MKEAAHKLIEEAKGNKTSTQQFPGRIDDLTISCMRDGKMSGRLKKEKKYEMDKKTHQSEQQGWVGPIFFLSPVYVVLQSIAVLC